MSLTNASAGFTLIELVTTIVIVAILGAVALPRMFDNRAFSERAYIDEVASTLRYAQKIAIASDCEVSVTINAGDYNAQQRAASGNTCDPVGAWVTPVLRNDGTRLSGTAPSNVVLAPATTITFRADGSLAGAAPALTVGPFTLGIDAASGRVTIAP